ncbi:Hypothetical predicted protein [Paramuricea clavata]|uniref:Uncharacterized protein n=1 Tax=Paramuricea clavata TaxID=317549 RepID=A0A7D9EG83_PARCT|nr:Hypothetical predicted protein [Paramuricea clavata]
MSEENPDTTAVPVTNPVKTHVTDPRRVELGRRLAKISKEAKARKKAQLEAIKEEEQSISDTEDKGNESIVTLDRQEEDEKPKENKTVEEPEPIVITPKGPDLFD